MAATGSKIRVGVDSFSFHRWFGEANQWEHPIEDRWSPADLIAHVATLGVSVLSLQTVYLPELTSLVIRELRDQLDQAGLEPILAWGHRSGLDQGRNPEQLEAALRAVEAGRALGCRLVRIVCGDQSSWTRDEETRRANSRRLRPQLEALAARAEQLKLSVAVENHADRSIEDLLELVSIVDSDRLGLCFDLGNAVRVGDDPRAAARAAAPFCFMTHLRDLKLSRGETRQPSDWWPCTALGHGDLDIPAVLGELILGGVRTPIWLVEASNIAPEEDERSMVAESVSYLRRFLASREASPFRVDP